LAAALLILAIVVTFGWLLTAALYVDGRIGWINLLSQHPSELAALLAGIFAPLAVAWLVIAYLRQGAAQRELAFALRQLHWQARKSTEQTETIVRTLAEAQSRARRDSALELAMPALSDLTALAAQLALAFERVAHRDLADRWAMTQDGDRWAFFRLFLNADESDGERIADLADRLAGAPHLRPVIADYLRQHEKLTEFLRTNEIDALLRDRIEDGPPGALYALLLSVLRHDPVVSSPAPPPAESADPGAARLASQVARVLWPGGVAALASAPPPSPPPQPANVASLASARAASPPISSSAEDVPARGSTRVAPFSPLSPEFPPDPANPDKGAAKR